jgi:hypothetical protein
MVPEERVRDLGSVAEEWGGVEEGRDRVPAAGEREPEVRAEEAVQVRAEVCGTAGPAGVVVQVLVVGREQEEAAPEVGEPVADQVEAELGLDPEDQVRELEAPAEDGARELDRVGVADQVEAVEERVRVWAEDSGQAEPVLVRVVEQDLAEVALVRVEVGEALEPGVQELAEGERGRVEDSAEAAQVRAERVQAEAERGSRENG